MARDYLSDLEVEMEIERLNESEFVKMAQKEIRLKYKRRLRLYNLRSLEKRGRQLAAEGATLETLEAMLKELEAADSEER